MTLEAPRRRASCTGPDADDHLSTCPDIEACLMGAPCSLVRDVAWVDSVLLQGCDAVHAVFARRRRRAAWTARGAWVLAAGGWWAALAGDRDLVVLLAALASLVAILVFAVRSGARVNAEAEHAAQCPGARS